MFQSYTYKDLGYDDKLKRHRYEYTIVDDDFIAVGVTVGISGPGAFPTVVIEEYGRRNLLVVPNLFRCLCFVAKKYGYSMQQIIDWNVKYNRHYSQYEEEISKLLLLL